MKQLQSNNIPSEKSCQPLFENQLNFNLEDRLLAECGQYCVNIIQQENSPWQHHANLIGYWQKKGQTKLSKLQKKALHYLHQWYFSQGKSAYLKTTTLADHLKTSRQATQRTITRLIDRGILIRLEYWSDRYQRFRSVLLPNLYKTPTEKLVFALQKIKHPLPNEYLLSNNPEQNQSFSKQTVSPPSETVTPLKSEQNQLLNKQMVIPPSVTGTPQLSETGTGGCPRYFDNVLNLLRIQKCNIYINILYTNYCANNYYSKKFNFVKLTSPVKKTGDDNLGGVTTGSINPLPSNTQEINNMQTKVQLKPKRIILKVKKKAVVHPPSIDESISILKKKNFNIDSIPQVAVSDLLYYIENRIFMDSTHNNPDIESLDLNSLFRVRMFNNQFIKQYDSKLFKMLTRLFIDDIQFNDPNLIYLSKKIISHWSASARKNKTKNKNTKFTNHNPNLKTKMGFKLYIGILYHLHYNLTPAYTSNPLYKELFEKTFIQGIDRFFNYAYAFNLPKSVSFDIALIDYNDSGRFLKCLTMLDDEFISFINSSKKSYRVNPENERSLNNFKQIFVDSFYEKKPTEGKKRFEQFKPRFSRFMEILINRIEKYSENGKRVELCGLKLTAETPQDMPVLYYYMEWLKSSIFSETVFSFDEMFSLNNWTVFIKNFMRNERGYSNYWKIVDTK